MKLHELRGLDFWNAIKILEMEHLEKLIRQRDLLIKNHGPDILKRLPCIPVDIARKRASIEYTDAMIAIWCKCKVGCINEAV